MVVERYILSTWAINSDPLAPQGRLNLFPVLEFLEACNMPHVTPLGAIIMALGPIVKADFRRRKPKPDYQTHIATVPFAPQDLKFSAIN